jgi:hypothetical protein
MAIADLTAAYVSFSGIIHTPRASFGTFTPFLI